MAQRVQVQLIDDIDGGTAEETVAFALDGTGYEIDLSSSNADALRDAMQVWVSGARRVAGAKGRRQNHGDQAAARPGRVLTGAAEQNAAVRAWARARGMPVRARGRIPASVTDAYHQAN